MNQFKRSCNGSTLQRKQTRHIIGGKRNKTLRRIQRIKQVKQMNEDGFCDKCGMQITNGIYVWWSSVCNWRNLPYQTGTSRLFVCNDCMIKLVKR